MKEGSLAGSAGRAFHLRAIIQVPQLGMEPTLKKKIKKSAKKKELEKNN